MPMKTMKFKYKRGFKLYRCDPDKHGSDSCRRISCYRNGGYCKYTLSEKYKMSFWKRIKEWFKYRKELRNVG